MKTTSAEKTAQKSAMEKGVLAARALPVCQPKREHEIDEKRQSENEPVDDPDEAQFQDGGKKADANNAPKPSIKGPGFYVTDFHRRYLRLGGDFCNRSEFAEVAYR